MDVEFGAHEYVDMSDLNAKWDQDWPDGYYEGASPIHGLGTSNGSLSGNALRIQTRGLGADPYYPWRSESADTRLLQQNINTALAEQGFMTLDVDGVLGPATCGAARAVGVTAPSTCQEFTDPMRLSGGGGSPLRAGVGGSPNWILWGAAAGAVAVGYALIWKAMKGKKAA
jgi:hypothetical protein